MSKHILLLLFLLWYYPETKKKLCLITCSLIFVFFTLAKYSLFSLTFGFVFITGVCVLGGFSRVRLFETPWTAAYQAPLAMVICPGKNTGVGCHALFQGIFLTKGWNSCDLDFLHWQVHSLPLASPGKPIFIIFVILLKVIMIYILALISYLRHQLFRMYFVQFQMSYTRQILKADQYHMHL